MIDEGSEIALCVYGSYQSDERLAVHVTVRNDGYDIVSSAVTWYDEKVQKHECHVPFGFFFTSSQFVVLHLRQNGIIPEGLSHIQIHLLPDAAEELYQYDKEQVRRQQHPES